MAEEDLGITYGDLPQKKGETVIAEEKQDELVTVDATSQSQEEKDKARAYCYPLSIKAGGSSSKTNFPNKIIFRAYRVSGVNIAQNIRAGIGKLIEKGGEIAQNLAITEQDQPTYTGPLSRADIKQVEPTEDQSLVDKAVIKAEEAGGALKDFFVGQSFSNPGTGREVGSVTLPLPRDLRYSDMMQYETANLGVIGAAGEAAIRGRNPFAGISLMSGGLAQATSSIGAQILARVGGSVAAGAVGGALGGVPGAFLGALAAGDVGEGLEAGVRSATRIVAAPNSKTIFQNVSIRNFNFAFKLVAYSEDEGKEIREMIKFFRQEMYPEVINLGSSGIPLAYTFPSEFEIEIKNKNDEQPAPKIGRCYLRDVQLSYNSTALGMYSDGNFVEVDIVLSFVEIQALHRGKIIEGY